MKRGLFVWLLIFLLVIFAQSFLSHFLIKNFVGSFVLVFLLILVAFLKIDQRDSWKFLVGGGLLADLFFFAPLGFHALSFLLAGSAFFYLKDKVFSQIKRSAFFSLSSSVFLAVILNQTIAFIFYLIFNFFNLKYNLYPHFFSSWFEFGYAIVAYFIFYTVAYLLIKKITPWLSNNSKTLFIKR